MFTNLFKALHFLLLLLLLCFTVYEYAQANSVVSLPSGNDNVELFKIETITDALNPNAVNNAASVKVTSYYSPSLLATDDMMIAVVGVNRTDKPDENIDILAKYIVINDKWNEKDFASIESKCKKQLAFQQPAGKESKSYVVKSLLTVAKQDKVYLLLVNYTHLSDQPKLSDLQFKLVVGEVNNEKKIVWVEDTDFTEVSVTEEFRKKFNQIQLSSDHFSGSAFLTKEGKIVFLVVVNAGEKMIALIHLNSAGKEPKLVLPKIDKDCYPFYFPWKNKIIMVLAKCPRYTNKNIMETTNMGENWEVGKDIVFQYYDFLQSKENFVTIKNGTEEILLFTEERLKTIKPHNSKKEILLWMSDGTRVGFVGNLDHITENEFYGSLFYAKDSFFALLLKYTKGKYDEKVVNEVLLRPLKKELNIIKDILTSWKHNDDNIKNVCGHTNDKNSFCTLPLSTVGLVGFLHNTNENTIWKDEYYFANATVKSEAKKVENGFRFSGEGVGAKWEVGKAPEEQPYSFTASGFTLVAAVTIEKNEEKIDNSLLGVVINGGKKLVHLWCSSGNWAVGDEKKKNLNKNNKKCEQGKTYAVALVLREGNVLVHVDWEQMTDLIGDEMKIGKTDIIKYFYFGADGETLKSAKTGVTVTNVFLYNRPFTYEEINILKQKTEQIAQLGAEKNKDDNRKENVEGNTSKTNMYPGTSSTETATENDGVKIKLCLFSMNSVTELFVLFGVFTLLGRYVY